MERSREQPKPTRAPQPLTEDPALNPQPAPRPSVTRQAPTPAPRTQPKYYVSDDPPPFARTSTAPMPAAVPTPTPTPPTTTRATPRPITTQERRRSSRDITKDAASLEDPPVVTPSTGSGYAGPLPPRHRPTEGSPLAATPPMTLPRADSGRDESALTGSDSMVGREYVLVEKGQVEVNKLADGQYPLLSSLAMSRRIPRTDDCRARTRKPQTRWSITPT